MPMYNLIDYKWTYSDTTGSLWFYSKDKATNFDADITNTNAFRYKVKIIKKDGFGGNNLILKSATIDVLLKDLSNFWQSHEMPLINCMAEIKRIWTKHCVLTSTGVENDDTDSKNVIFTIK